MSEKRKLDEAFDRIQYAVNKGLRLAGDTIAYLESALTTIRGENERLVAELETLYTPGNLDLDEDSPDIAAFGLREDNHNPADAEELIIDEHYYVLTKNVMYRGTFEVDKDADIFFSGVELWTTKGWKRVTNKCFASSSSEFFFLV
jgi:hypothetical protein